MLCYVQQMNVYIGIFSDAMKVSRTFKKRNLLLFIVYETHGRTS